tara:strand:+ start:985 stop:1212 length:228 start_codon:yes stop_codon:yes gene_type:complete
MLEEFDFWTVVPISAMNLSALQRPEYSPTLATRTKWSGPWIRAVVYTFCQKASVDLLIVDDVVIMFTPSPGIIPG